jgi:hypothetical protein
MTNKVQLKSDGKAHNCYDFIVFFLLRDLVPKELISFLNYRKIYKIRLLIQKSGNLSVFLKRIRNRSVIYAFSFHHKDHLSNKSF